MLPSLMVSKQSFDYFWKQLLVIVVTLMSSSWFESLLLSATWSIRLLPPMMMKSHHLGLLKKMNLQSYNDEQLEPSKLQLIVSLGLKISAAEETKMISLLLTRQRIVDSESEGQLADWMVEILKSCNLGSWEDWNSTSITLPIAKPVSWYELLLKLNHPAQIPRIETSSWSRSVSQEWYWYSLVLSSLKKLR